MYGLPSDFDPQVFVGHQLEAITFAENVIVLGFSDRLTVSVSGAVPYRDGPDAEMRVDTPPVSCTSLVKLVGRNVVAIELKSPRELILQFEDDASATLLDGSDLYESYLINTGQREIIV